MSKLKLTYFDFPGSRGEECRLALWIAGVDFTDVRVGRDQWATLKPTTPFGSMPVLELEGKPPVSQSNAILSWIGSEYSLSPGDSWERMRVESLLQACEELRHSVTATFGIKGPEELKKRREELAAGTIRTWGANMQKQVTGPFVYGSEIGIADIKIFIVMSWITKGVLDHVPADVFADNPKLLALQQAVAEHPKVKAWYAR